uniref:Uncharacterized protein n=1 Tax=Ananas comosus var. bracteatus TaxID=296719 RepID=A0A6V7PTX9_ANACO|nr:unnamed protein product [Ananas comosus var. bracteatus]
MTLTVPEPKSPGRVPNKTIGKAEAGRKKIDGNDLQGERDQLHVVMLPYFAFGHVLPFLELGRALARRGHRVSLLAPAALLRRLPAPAGATPLLSFVALPPLPTCPPPSPPPPTCPQTAPPPPEVARLPPPLLRRVRRRLLPQARLRRPRLRRLLGRLLRLPARRLLQHLPRLHRRLLRPHQPRRLHRAAQVGPLPHRRRLPPPRAAPDLPRLGAPQRLRRARVGPAQDGPRRRRHRRPAVLPGARARLVPAPVGPARPPVVPLGLLPSTQAADGNLSAHHPRIFEFLEAQKTGSAIYVALGSEAVLTAELLRELALAWSSRMFRAGPRCGGGVPDALRVELGGGGPAARAGAGAAAGVRRPGAERAGDGGEGRGVEVERDEDSGFFSRSAVAEAVRKVVAGEEGAKVRAKAKEVSKVVGDVEMQDKYVDGFVKCLKEHRARESNI